MFKKIKSFVLSLLAISILASCVSTSNAPKISSAEKKPKFERALLHTQLARGYMEKQHYGIARDELEKALRLAPNHSDSNYVMGLLMLELKNNEDADYYLSRAVETDRENSSAAHDYGMLLCQTGQESKAIDFFEIAVSNPLFKRAGLSYMRAGECLARIDDPRTEQFLKRALQINPRLGPALYGLAQFNKGKGKNLSARAYIERYMAITKPQPDALLMAYEIESSLKAYDVAERYRKRILENFPGSRAARTLRSSQRD